MEVNIYSGKNRQRKIIYSKKIVSRKKGENIGIVKKYIEMVEKI